MSRDEREWTLARMSNGDLIPIGDSPPMYSEHEQVVVVPKTALEAAEAERDEARQWAASSENPAFDAGWSAGKKRADHDMYWRAEQAEAERDSALDEVQRWVEENARIAAEADTLRGAPREIAECLEPYRGSGHIIVKALEIAQLAIRASLSEPLDKEEG